MELKTSYASRSNWFDWLFVFFLDGGPAGSS